MGTFRNSATAFSPLQKVPLTVSTHSCRVRKQLTPVARFRRGCASPRIPEVVPKVVDEEAEELSCEHELWSMIWKLPWPFITGLHHGKLALSRSANDAPSLEPW